MGVIIEYKGTGRMRIVDSAAERRAILVINITSRHQQQLADMPTGKRTNMLPNKRHVESLSDKSSDIKCWKRTKNGKPHARRGWQRHPNRAHA